MKSWKTTVFGAGGLLTVVAAAVSALFDGDPLTNPDWTAVIAGAAACIGLIFAKDSNVTGGTTPQ